jgi:predicted AAA+ superfamily ATPase
MSENIHKYRFLQSLLPDPGQPQLVLLTGARQTGKTTLVKRLCPQLRYSAIRKNEYSRIPRA